ncbi:MAG: hypothetical protein WD767_08655 [Alphaproteobacteria bacterium]
MRNLITILVLLGMLAASPTGRAEDFIEGFEDVPVMPGMAVDADTAIAFDTPAGRIVEAYAAGNVSAAAIRKFYDDTLPQLGWVRVGVLAFQREGEALALELIKKDETITVRFRLAPTPK